MNILKHMIENLFVTATGIAALIHSTWSLGTIFSGTQPDPAINPLGFAGWIIPALLIAFALDIGQIFTSAEIRQGDKRIIKYVTFGIFAVATYYLQWLYMAHHIPLLGLEAGIREEWLPQVTLLRDMAIWIVPAFMPLSTALYTISQREEPEDVQPKIDIKKPLGTQLLDELPNNASTTPELPETLPRVYDLVEYFSDSHEDDTEPYEPIDADNAHNLTCPDCGWETGPRLRLESAERSLRTHQARYCDAMNAEVE